MAKDSGFIKIGRSLFEHEFFTEHREYSRFEAWLDLIQLCAFEENNTMLFRGRIIKWGRGQTIASVRYLQQRWGWKSTKKIISFLELLRSQKMIETDTSQGLQRITLCKYESYNSSGNTRETQSRTQRKQTGNEIKELNKLKNLRESTREDFENGPDVNDVVRYFLGAGGTEEMAHKFYNRHSSTNWLLNGARVTNWTFLANNYMVTWMENEKKYLGDSKPKKVSTIENNEW